jgi:UTP--glucose-1-phosphate uridylyltransferase
MTTAPQRDKLSAFAEKMAGAGLSKLVIDTFAHYYRKVVSGETGLVFDRDIRPVRPADIAFHEKLGDFRDDGHQAMAETVRIVLNGGLGTSMGLTGPKSLIQAKAGQSFLQTILRQSGTGPVRLALMNSFNTHEATLKALAAEPAGDQALLFLQHKFPKILKDTLEPAEWPANRELEWNPPGHGDVYLALHESGLLEALMADGIRYAFISNCDNLGARVEPALLGYFAANDFSFMMEVAEKTPADLKGGHLARRGDGRLILREAAQCPQDEIDAFQDIERYRYFNTNNIWVRLDRIQGLVRRHRIIDLPMILNPKTLDPRNSGSPPVFQVESAMGAAISMFDQAGAVCVPRSRFFPVKTTNDLLAVRSDAFEYTADHSLQRRSGQPGWQTLEISLDPEYYKKIDQLEDRFPAGPPSLRDCSALSVEGDVRFEGGVIIRGNVKITNNGDRQAVVPADTVIENDMML